MFDQRLPIVDSDDGVWGDILRQYLMKEHYNDDTDNAANGGHQNITVRAGTAGAGGAPLKFTSGTLLSSPEVGAVEFVGDNLYVTQTSGATRKKVALYNDASGATGDIYYRDGSGYFTRLGVGSNGNVLTLSGGLPSWSNVALTSLTSDTTTALGVGSINLGHASDTTITRTGAGAIAVEGVGVALNSTSLAHTAGTIELGHASDTTLARGAAGRLTVEGVNVPTISSVDTLTNKTLTAPRINSISGTNGNAVLGISDVASAVNSLYIANNTAGNIPHIKAQGSDANIPVSIASKGTGVIRLQDGSWNTMAAFSTATSPVNYVNILNSPTGTAPSFNATGSDSDIGINLVAKGTGTVQANGVDVATTTATQTLTNKTIDGGNNTLQNIPQSAITNLSTDISNKLDKVDFTNKARGGANIAVNSDFEDTTVGRTNYGSPVSPGYSTEQARSGTNSWKWTTPTLGSTSGIQFDPSDPNIVSNVSVRVQSGDKYYISAWVYPHASNDHASGGAMQLTCRFVDSTGTLSNTYQSESINLSSLPVSQWTKLHVSLDTPSGYDLAVVFLTASNSTPQGNIYYADDLVWQAVSVYRQGGELELFNTKDEETNYEKYITRYNSNILEVGHVYGGSASSRAARFGTGSAAGGTMQRYIQVQSGTPFVSYNWSGTTLTGQAINIGSGNTFTASSGNQTALGIDPTINQTSTAGYTGLLINPTESGTGSGTKRLIDAQVGGAARFSVDNAGNAIVMGTLDLGNASDTTLSRSSAGVLAVEGVVVPTVSSVSTLTNKTLTAPVISSISNSGTITIPTGTDTLVGRATTDTLTNKTMSGSSNTFSNIPASAITGLTTDYSRLVCSTASGSTGAENGANTWAHIATFSTGTNQFSECSVILAVTNAATSTHDTAIISVFLRSNSTSSDPTVDVRILAKAGTGPHIVSDSFKVISDGWSSDMQLWVKKGSNYGGLSFYEVSKRIGGNSTLTYTTTPAWQSATPTGSVNNVSSNGVHSGLPFTANGTITGTELISNVSTGTAPLTVASTTKVTNLNADLLDDMNATSALTGNTIVARDVNGDFNVRYLMSTYVNMSHSAAARNSDTVFYSSTDAYIRKNTVTGFKTSLALENVDNTSDATKNSAAATLTNKTITAPVLSGTITGTYTLGGTPTFPSSVVTTTGAQALSNKDMTSGTNTWPTFNQSTTGNAATATTATNQSGGTVSATTGDFSSYTRTNELRTLGGQQLVLNAGESHSQATGQTSEFVYVNAEDGLQVNSSPDNWATGWAGRITTVIDDTGITWNGNTVWHAGNDGTGSGLDADTLDGQHAAAFASSSHTHTATNISDSTAVGRSVLTATDAAAARTAIGAGTGNGDVTLSGAQDLTNKTIGNSNILTVRDDRFTLQDNSDTTKQAAFELSGISTGTTRTYTLPNVSGTILTSGAITVSDTGFTLQDNSDVTKQLQFQLSGISTATTRTLTVPNANTTLVGTDTSQTLSNKTLGSDLDAGSNKITSLATPTVSTDAATKSYVDDIKVQFDEYTSSTGGVTGASVPSGIKGCFISQIGGGGGGSSGVRGVGSVNRPGGGGGAGGCMNLNVWVPAAALGATFSVTCPAIASGGNSVVDGTPNPGGNGGDVTFTSGSFTLVATGGPGGSGSTGGTHATTACGYLIGAPGATGTTSSAPSSANSNGDYGAVGAPGGGGGSGHSSSGTLGPNGGDGGSALTHNLSGGAGSPNVSTPPGSGSAAIAGQTGGAAGGGTGGGDSSIHTDGADAIAYGAGGGGGGGQKNPGDATSGAGGNGGPAYCSVTWVF